MVSENFFLAQNGTKIILNTFQDIHRVFYCRIQEFANPTKLNLIMLLDKKRNES